MILLAPLDQVITVHWKYYPNSFRTYLDMKLKSLDKEHTYVCVCSLGQEEYLQFFRECKEIKILYEGPQAINTRYSKTQKRNTVVVWEHVDEVNTTGATS
jgi:hypothetical protein